MVIAGVFGFPDWLWDLLLLIFVVIPLALLWIGSLVHIVRRRDIVRLQKLLWFVAVLLFPLIGTFAYLVRQPVIRVIERTPGVMLGQAADTVGALSPALDNFATTMSLAQSTMVQGAGLIGDMSDMLARADATLGFTVPFTQIRPLGPAHAEVRALGVKARSLGRSLERTADALGTNAADLRAMAGNVSALAGTLGLAPRAPGRPPGDGVAPLLPAASQTTVDAQLDGAGTGDTAPNGALNGVSTDPASPTGPLGSAPSA